jgi:hypothetical protein
MIDTVLLPGLDASRGDDFTGAVGLAGGPPAAVGGPPDGWNRLTDAIEALQRAAAQLQDSLSQLRGSASAAPPAAARSEGAGGRHLVYVHGICKQSAGYSDGWWASLRPFTDAFGDGARDGARHEVLWSDLVNAAGLTAAARPAAGADEWAARVRGVLEDRAATHAQEAGPSVTSPELARDLLARNLAGRDVVARDLSAFPGLNVPGIDCVEDFTVYMFNDSIRAQIIGRFTDVVRPLLEAGNELDIISHSWGTVVAYEGLRELEDRGLTDPRVRDFFTVGAALSIFLVKLRLRANNRDGRRPALVRRWVNLNAVGDPVGGRLQGRPYQVDAEFLNLANFGCGWLDAACAHSSYFKPENTPVNRDIFADFIDRE